TRTQGTDGVDANGNPVNYADCIAKAVDCLISDEQIQLGDTRFQLCENGAIVDPYVGCDFNPPQCNENQIAVYGGCVDIAGTNTTDPTTNAPQSTSTTSTTNNPDGSTTTTTTRTTHNSGTGNGSGDGDGEDEEGNTLSGRGNCNNAPTCTGDPITCAIAKYEFESTCKMIEAINDAPEDLDTY